MFDESSDASGSAEEAGGDESIDQRRQALVEEAAALAERRRALAESEEALARRERDLERRERDLEQRLQAAQEFRARVGFGLEDSSSEESG